MILTFPRQIQRDVQARLRLIERCRTFEPEVERQRRLALEDLRRIDHALKPWLQEQRVRR